MIKLGPKIKDWQNVPESLGTSLDVSNSLFRRVSENDMIESPSIKKGEEVNNEVLLLF